VAQVKKEAAKIWPEKKFPGRLDRKPDRSAYRLPQVDMQ
jgi:hypothetical protein